MKYLVLSCYIILAYVQSTAQKTDKEGFLQEFDRTQCIMDSHGGNEYFKLEPGYQLTLESPDRKEILVITVLNETRKINGIETRVVEERETKNGQITEISRNYFAACRETGDVYYFGEEVDVYKNGRLYAHSGAWVAEEKNKAGLIMPGKPVTGMKYYQEIAPKIAMDRAEIIGTAESLETPAGKFSRVLKTEETTPLEPNDKSYKQYAPGIGLVQDDQLLLVRYFPAN